MHYLYIIHSATIDKYYVGESPDPINRLDRHNQHYFKKGFTKAASDWKIVLSSEFDSMVWPANLRKSTKIQEFI